MIDRIGMSSTAEPADPSLECGAEWHAAASPQQRRWSYRRDAVGSDDASGRLSSRRIVVLALVLALHGGVLLRMTLPSPARLPAAPPMVDEPTGADTTSGRLQVTFLRRVETIEPVAIVTVAPVVPQPRPIATPRVPPEPAQVPPRPPVPQPSPADPVVATPALPTSAPAPTTADSLTRPALPVDAPAPTARLFRPDGSIALPAAATADLDAIDSDARVFDYETPGLATAAAVFERPPALPYAPTRFEADWKPVRSIGGELLNTVAEALTYENERGTVRCSLVPPMCSWGSVDGAVELDDPDTLNPAEDAQCRIWWDQIVAATDQGAWLELRERYDTQCRKPLEAGWVPVDDRAAPQ